MKIRYKLILYFGLLLLICFGAASILTRIFLKNAINRLVYSNVVEMNETIADSLDGSSLNGLLASLETIRGVTGVEIIVYRGENALQSTFVGDSPDLSTAYLASETYEVFTVRHLDQVYYYTSEPIEGSDFSVLIFRGENLALQDDLIYYAGFIGIIFLIFSVSTVSFFTTRSFTDPIRELAGYANRLSLDALPEPKPQFETLEFNELGTALEKASIRLSDYHRSEQEFLHNFSHEMKSPLTNIYGYAEGMLYNVLSEEESKNACRIIMAESEKLKDTINQILLLGRLDSIHDSFQFRKVNLVDILSDALTSVQIPAKDAGIELHFAGCEEDHHLFADADKLETAFINILSNGIRYAKSRLTISVVSAPDTLTVLFDDDGPGIPIGEREKVFERYYTGYKGHTGLGLTITKAIIEGHKAKIEVQDSPENGARFVLTFSKKANQEKTGREAGKTENKTNPKGKNEVK